MTGAVVAGRDRLEADLGGLPAEERLGAQPPGAVAEDESVAEALRRRLDALRRGLERVLGEIALDLAAAGPLAGGGACPGPSIASTRAKIRAAPAQSASISSSSLT